jgi:hypothetical protein
VRADLPGADPFDPNAAPITDITQAPAFELVDQVGGGLNVNALVANLADRITF